MQSQSPTSVAFPSSSDSQIRPVPHSRPTHLPFRRISLPTAPTLMHRESVVSVASFDSLPEEGVSPGAQVPAIMRNVNASRKSKPRPGSMDSPRKRRSTKLANSALEAKKRKIIQEFYDTEKAYVDGLELIYQHFLTPILATLDAASPLLDRAVLTSVFSNFIDIWNFHRSFFSSLTTLLFPDPSQPMSDAPLSPILLSHFPYLSLYTPFITAFPTTMSSLTNFISPPTANRPNPDYNHAFASFLAVQESDPRCGKLKLRDWLLTIVQRCPRYLLLLKDLIECTSADDDEQAQLKAAHALVSKITSSLNTSLHTHAQTLSLLALQRATPNLPFQLITPGRTLLKRGSLMQIERSETPREREFLLFSDCLIWLAPEGESSWTTNLGWSNNGSKSSVNNLTPTTPESPERPPMLRSRSKSEAELPVLKAAVPQPPRSPSKTKSVVPPPPKSKLKRYASSTNAGVEEKWTFKGKAELIDMEVVITPPRESGEERRFEVLSPEGSFVLFADNETERDEWCSMIRQAKAQLLVSLNVTHPNSTLTSSSSTTHIRKALQALPFSPSDERVGSVKRKGEPAVIERRGKVDHWVPAIWIPDEKAEGCMRCGRSFGWRRRRHHCRLCGRCVCASCSDRTFYISDPNSKHKSSKPARACNACYETVFPLLDVESEEETNELSPVETHSNTLTSLTNLPSWLSMPSLPLASTPEALMAMPVHLRRDSSPSPEEVDLSGSFSEGGRIRVKSPPSRPRSYHQVFNEHVTLLDSAVQEEDDESITTSSSNYNQRPTAFNLSISPPKENTARRHKRFSFPAVALQTTSVTARSGEVQHHHHQKSAISHGYGNRSKRFSLVLGHGGRSQHHSTRSEFVGSDGKDDLSKGVAAGKLSELLGKKKVEAQ